MPKKNPRIVLKSSSTEDAVESEESDTREVEVDNQTELISQPLDELFPIQRGSGGSQKSIQKTIKKRKKARHESFSKYIYKILKSVHADKGISRRSMSVLNSMMMDIFERIAGEAARLSTISKGKTITTREIETATKLILPGQLSTHACKEGVKALIQFNRST